MSISYFVEGKIKIHFKGDIKVYSKENIVNSTHQTITQTGKENGISYGKADTLHQNDKPINGIDVTLNLFFDGTGNNKTNTDARKTGSNHYLNNSNQKDDSYENDYSNIVRGYDAVDSSTENQIKVYIEGIGTEDLGEDISLYAKGFGLGNTGIVGKVTKGCIKSANDIYKKIRNKKTDRLVVNVFGFSRGAAAARHFLHIASTPAKFKEHKNKKLLEVSPPHSLPNSKIFIDNTLENKEFINRYGYFGACLIKKKLLIKKILFNFVGLYDTVASYGIHSNDTTDLRLDSVKKAYFVLQIASDDDFRENFRLTNINSCGLKGLQLTLPGVHSDIGGSYRDGSREKKDLFKYEHSILFNSKYQKVCEKYRKQLISEGWFSPEQIKIIGDSSHYIVGKRILFNHYDRIPLYMMFHYSKKFKIKYRDEVVNKMINIQGKELTNIYNGLIRYMNTCNQMRNDYIDRKIKGNYIEDIKKKKYNSFVKWEDLKYLRNRYLHWSVIYGDIVHGQEVSEAVPHHQRKRKIQDG